MTRLQLELRRLYLAAPPVATADLADPGVPSAQDGESGEAGLVDAEGQVRALVLELARPADWAALLAVWQGVQADLALPAPAIAVNGRDGYQLWFSLARPIPAAQGRELLEALCQRYLGAIKPQRLTLLPAVEADPGQSVRHAELVPARRPGSEVWSAFVAQDLAPMFADEPWLDLPPGSDGQAQLLARLTSMAPGEVARALGLLRPVADRPRSPEPPPAWTPGSFASPPADCPSTAGSEALAAPESVDPIGATARLAGDPADPVGFLLEVMRDERVPLALRIDAAKALLPYAGPTRRP
ncbi:MAG: hypothetical protein RL375_4512 [Pseudomonadota bacterium]|jgi:hypothetical protein